MTNDEKILDAIQRLNTAHDSLVEDVQRLQASLDQTITAIDQVTEYYKRLLVFEREMFWDHIRKAR